MLNFGCVLFLEKIHPGISNIWWYTLPETSSEFTPENGWLEYDRFLFGRSIFRRAAGLNLQQKHRFFPNKHAAHHLGPSFDIDFVIVSSNTVFLISQFGYWYSVFAIIPGIFCSIAILRRWARIPRDESLAWFPCGACFSGSEAS